MAINLLSGSEIICLPGCVIRRGFSNGTGGIIRCAGQQNVTWTGGRLQWYDAGQGLPTGTGLRIVNLGGNASRNIVFEDFVVDGYAQESAISIIGERVTLINPMVLNPDLTNSNGIRVGGGTGFRCYGGYAESGGDAALQFSASANGGGITDGAYIGTRAKASGGGRLLLVGTQNNGSVHNVRFIGVSGAVENEASLVAIHNIAAQTTSRISDVLLRDVVMSRPLSDSDKDGIVIENYSTEPGGGVFDVRFENVVIDYPGGTGLRVRTNGVGAVPVRNVSWRGGRIVDIDGGGCAISLSNVETATFEGLRLAGATNQTLLQIGVGGPVSNARFSDCSVVGILAGKTGVVFDQATACGWTRGALTGDASAMAFAMTANARGCSITSANLAGIGVDPTVSINPAATSASVSDNYGSTVRTAVEVGPIMSANLTGQTVATVSSSVGANYTGASPPGLLKTIDGVAAGDLLVTSRTISANVTALDDVGNLRLKSNFALTTPDDTLFLLRRSDGILLELSRSDNA